MPFSSLSFPSLPPSDPESFADKDFLSLAISSKVMRAIEASMIDEFGVDWNSVIDRAAQTLAHLATTYLDSDVTDRPIVVLAGSATKGAVGLATARHLLQAGAWVQTLCSHPADELHAATAHQWMMLQAAGGQLSWAEEGWELPPCDLLIDALIGSDLHTEAQGRTRELILLANSSAAPILSVELPSGVDGDTGHCFSPHIIAIATLMLGLPPTGVFRTPARNTWGELYLADIGIPKPLYLRFGIKQPPTFDQNGLLKLEENFNA